MYQCEYSYYKVSNELISLTSIHKLTLTTAMLIACEKYHLTYSKSIRCASLFAIKMYYLVSIMTRDNLGIFTFLCNKNLTS